MTAALERNKTRFQISLIVLMMVLLVSPRPDAMAAVAGDDCIQPSIQGCPLPLGQPVRGTILDPAQVDTWVVHLDATTDLRVSLTNLTVDYDVHVYQAGDVLRGESQREGTVDDLVQASGLPPGDYFVYVNSPRGATSPSPYTLAADLSGQWQFLYADDFSDPARGRFAANQQGTGRYIANSGARYSIQWDSRYGDGALLARLFGPYPDNPDKANIAANIYALDKITGDFAVEAGVQAIRSPLQTRYALIYALPSGQGAYGFAIRPGFKSYYVSAGQIANRRILLSGSSRSIGAPADRNVMRLEVRGTTMWAYVNGEFLDSVRDDDLAVRGGQVGFVASMDGPPADGDVEVHFTAFKVYAWAP